MRLILIFLVTFLSGCDGTVRQKSRDGDSTHPSSPEDTRAAQGRQLTIAIQPLGESLSVETVTLVRQALQTFYGARITMLPNMELPKTLYYKPRNRYSAAGILDLLADKKPDDVEKILGLTAVDIYHGNEKSPHWGVLGLGSLDGSSCVISIHRARVENRVTTRARQRFAKTAVHEIGHTLNLSHCETKGCLMEDARGKVATTDGEYELCPLCRRKLNGLGRKLPENPKPPWPKP